MEAMSPVVAGLEQFEIVVGEGQPEYTPLPTLVGGKPTMTFMSRWRFTDEERALIAAGADLYYSQLTFGSKFAPMNMSISHQPASSEVPLIADMMNLQVSEKNIAAVLDKLTDNL